VTAAELRLLLNAPHPRYSNEPILAAAALYLQKAQLGWQFLTNAIVRYGKPSLSKAHPLWRQLC